MEQDGSNGSPRSLPYLESLYVSPGQCGGSDTLVVSFPGRKGNRHFNSTTDLAPFLGRTLNCGDSHVLHVRAVYDREASKAYDTRDYELLPHLIASIRRQIGARHVVLSGFSLGCGPCLWLAKKGVADALVLIAPGLLALDALTFMDGVPWRNDFENYCHGGLPQMEKLSEKIKVTIVHGQDLEEDRLRERDLVQYLSAVAPQANVQWVPGVGHYVLYFWQRQETLREKLFDLLEIRTGLAPKPDPGWQRWTRLKCGELAYADAGLAGLQRPADAAT